MPDHPRKLVLIDGYSLLFRAFFSSRALTTTDGRPTGALYGFANMIFLLIRNEKPDAMIVCWDAHQTTHRKAAFDDYKAHRAETPSDLMAQMFPARDLMADFGIQSAELGGYEADDLVGTLAFRGLKEGYQVEIITGDSDQLQLVKPGITVQITQKGVSEVKRYDHDVVVERYGIAPDRIPDWKGLVGDTSDNIPGVPGIGDKTATALLQKFDTVEGIYERIEEVTPPRIKGILEANKESALFSKELATIVCDAPFEAEIQPYNPTPEIWNRLRAAFTELQFKTMLRWIPSDPVHAQKELAASIENAFSAEIVSLKTREELAEALKEIESAGRMAIALDVDSPAAMRANVRGVAFASTKEKAYYAALARYAAENGSEGEALGGLFDGDAKEADEHGIELGHFSEILALSGLELSAHNGKVAEIAFERAGIRVPEFAFDTQIAGYVLDTNASGYPLSDLAEKYLNCSFVNADPYAPEAFATQAALIIALREPMTAELDRLEMRRVYETVDLPLIPALAHVERTGLAMDGAYLNTLSARMAKEADEIARQIYEIAGEEFNIGSTKQLQSILFEKLQLPTGKKNKTGYSTGADLLEQLAPQFDIARKIIEYREVTKLRSTYAEVLPKLINPDTGRIHTSLHQTVAATGRLSSSDPNLQNIPIRSSIGREIRRAFIAPPGKTLLSCDYSQIELRILAHYTNDPALTEAFQNDRDVHAATAARVFDVPLDQVTSDQRRQAKTINFAVIYGQSGFALANTLGVDTSTANQWIKEYFEQLPGVREYIDGTIASVKEKKYVQTLLGRRRYMPDIDSANFQHRQFAERAAVNMPIQGTAADVMKIAMTAVFHWLEKECGEVCNLLLQVHDELLFEIDEDSVDAYASEIKKLMENAYPMNVPIKADAKFGHNWSEMQALPDHVAAKV